MRRSIVIKANLEFVMHLLSNLSDSDTAARVEYTADDWQVIRRGEHVPKQCSIYATTTSHSIQLNCSSSTSQCETVTQILAAEWACMAPDKAVHPFYYAQEE